MAKATLFLLFGNHRNFFWKVEWVGLMTDDTGVTFDRLDVIAIGVIERSAVMDYSSRVVKA